MGKKVKIAIAFLVIMLVIWGYVYVTEMLIG